MVTMTRNSFSLSSAEVTLGGLGKWGEVKTGEQSPSAQPPYSYRSRLHERGLGDERSSLGPSPHLSLTQSSTKCYIGHSVTPAGHGITINRKFTWTSLLTELKNNRCLSIELIEKVLFSYLFLTYILSWFSRQWHTASLSGVTATTWIIINPCKHCTVVLEG